jgi:hypothetical protein
MYELTGGTGVNVPNTTSLRTRSRHSAVGIATSYGMNYRGSRIFSFLFRPDRLWGPPSLLSNGYQGLFPLW